jgi:O-antigen/teichoic acid export membrane protein
MKTKKTALIFITDIIPLIIVSLLGIFKFKLFLKVLGDETLGLYQLFSQIMIYVALVDGGLSNAVLFSLYKPNVDGDKKKFNAILAGSFKSFSFIGMAVFGIATIVSFIVPFLIKDSIFGYWYIILTFLLFAISNVIGYFFVPYNCLLEVKEKKHIYNLTSQIGQIVLSVCEIIMLLANIKFAYILIMHSVVKLLACLAEAYICKKEFPDIKITQKEKNFEFKKHISSLLFHKINGLVGSNIDSIIISSFLGLKYVAIYSAYSYIITMMKNILGKISASMTAIVGNYLVKTKDKMYELFKEFNSMLFYIAIIICTPLTLAIDGFIDIFYEGEIITEFLIAISFVSILFTFIIKMDTTLFVSAGGLYKETQHCAITDTIVNLVLSLVLIHYVGISGVLIATAVAVMIAEYFMKTIVVHKKIFERSPKWYFITNIKFFVLYILDLIAGYYIIGMFTIETIWVWFIVFAIYTIINAFVILLIFMLLKEDKFMDRVKILLKRGVKDEKSSILTE